LRTERTEIWGRQPHSQGFHSICKWKKPVFWLGCYGCIFHATGNSAQLCQNFGISGGLSTPSPPGAPLPVTHWIGARGWTLWKRDNSLPGIKLQFLICSDRDLVTTDCHPSAFPSTKNLKKVAFIYTSAVAARTLVNKITSHQPRNFVRQRGRNLLESSESKATECEYSHIYRQTVCVRIKCAILSGYTRMRHWLIDLTELEMKY
jgi:hypothetical protein